MNSLERSEVEKSVEKIKEILPWLTARLNEYICAEFKKDKDNMDINTMLCHGLVKLIRPNIFGPLERTIFAYSKFTYGKHGLNIALPDIEDIVGIPCVDEVQEEYPDRRDTHCQIIKTDVIEFTLVYNNTVKSRDSIRVISIKNKYSIGKYIPCYKKTSGE